MQSKWGNFVKDYLTFSKKERDGILIMFFMAVAIYFISRYLPVDKMPVDKTAFQEELAQLKISIDSSPNAYAFQREN